ncbi:hypothetical protein MPH_13719 [Macrophomina phaseolina MS6]|uniref:Uncharacterized protein n=1 Tax=Macrophomina phaseolina (strain MS6) TaxID=1126212 RepID=K2R4Y0_MACPH|nr:hypothetical protein MPH_13719 [Macrophomina phaseolina MS6]
MSSDISSRTASILPTASTPSTPLHFDAVIRTEYIEITEETHSGRKRQKRSKIQYTCTICSSWSSHHRTNAIKHVNSRHPVPISSAQSSRSTPAPTRDISTIFTPNSSLNGLRNCQTILPYCLRSASTLCHLLTTPHLHKHRIAISASILLGYSSTHLCI